MTLRHVKGCGFLAAILLAGATVAAGPSGDWPLFRGNALQTGVATTELPAQLKVRWKLHVQDSVEATAAIANGVAYVPAMDEHLYSLDLNSGKEKWNYKAAPFKAAASVFNGGVYVGDTDGTFHCLNAADGKPRWTYKTGGEISSGANFIAGKVLFGSADETLYCLSTDGKEQWQFKISGGPVLGSPAVVGDRTFASGCDSMLHVIETAKGTELSSTDLGGQVGATIAVRGDHIYVGTMTNQMLAVDWRKGQVSWKFEAANNPQPFYASAAVTDKLVIAASRDRRVYALDRQTGKEAWNYPTRGRIDGSPVVVGGRVYVGSGDGKLYVLDLAKGTELQKIDLGGPITASPAVGERCLVIGTTRGDVYCLE
ncbi:MAG TPA: PQQ-binding-like beta-propeller repeat protein [Gemmataceae bacterium]|nr:PQQ-binding-like beta-propeller repeat protein [Gemmataceae bacterium]